jgi:predicted dehydrogenase/acetyltransferase-like isoleucine patch superfamily enzyme
MSNRHGVPARPFEELLADPGIDAVAIAAPAESHAALARRALAAGKHVFVEKPLGLDVAEAEDVCAAADASGLTLMVGHLLRYHSAFLRLQELVREGAVGRLQYLYSNRLNFGRIRREEDILWSFAPHDISMILALVGSEPEHVSAVGSNYLHKSIADVTTTHLAFPGGERAHVFVSWLHPYKEQRLVVVGDAGMVVFDDAEPWSSKLTFYEHRVDRAEGVPTAVKAAAVGVPVEEAEPLAAECRHFLECIATGRTPTTDGREGLRVLRVLQRASNSLRSGNQPDRSEPYFIHASSFVDEGVSVGAGTKVWHFSHLMEDSRIGQRCSLGQNVLVGPRVTIGDDCRIQNNVSIYEGVTLEDGVFCGPSCVFTNVANPRAEISRREDFRPTYVRRGATIGANATIVCGHEIGAYSFIAAGAVVTRDVPAHALMGGVPARRIGWVSHDGETLGDDFVCPRSGRKYVETGPEELHEVEDRAWT